MTSSGTSGGDAARWRDEGIALRGEGRLAEAAQALQRAVEAAPRDGRAHAELAHVLRWQGALVEARAAAERAVALMPALAAGWFNLGAVRDAAGEPELAERDYRQALAIDPAYAEAWSNLGGLLAARGDLAEAIAAYRQAVGARPALAPAWSNLGNALRRAGRHAEAVDACREAVRRAPGFAAGWINLAAALREQDSHEAALDAAQRALELAPERAEPWANLGGALAGLGRYAEAVRAHEQAVARDPGSAEAQLNLAASLENAGRVASAIASYRRAVALKPEFVDAQFGLAIALLTLGEFAEGWQRYEWRWRRPDSEPVRHAYTRWNGATTHAARLLVWGEQGVGDEIIYAGMIPELAATPLAVTLECDPRLVSLFARSFEGVRVVPKAVPSRVAAGEFDAQVPLASLGSVLRPSFARFPRHAGYLRADASRAAAFRRRLARRGPGVPVVGVSWLSRNAVFGAMKSLRLADLAPVFAAREASFVDLQYGDTREERARAEADAAISLEHLDDLDLYEDLDGLAALVAACDLVITASNVTAHVAGALGRPVWLMAPLARGRFWYWFSGRRDSPWYPSLTVFAQRAPGDWYGTLEEIAAAFSAYVPPPS